MKSKVFFCDRNTEEIQRTINKWLKKHTKIEVRTMSQVTSGDWIYTTIIYYDKLEEIKNNV